MANTFNDPFSAAIAASFNNDPFGVPRAPRPVEDHQVPYASPGAAAPAADLGIPVPTPEATASYQIASPPRQPITLSEFLINPNILSKFNGSKATAFDFYFANYLPAEVKKAGFAKDDKAVADYVEKVKDAARAAKMIPKHEDELKPEDRGFMARARDISLDSAKGLARGVVGDLVGGIGRLNEVVNIPARLEKVLLSPSTHGEFTPSAFFGPVKSDLTKLTDLVGSDLGDAQSAYLKARSKDRENMTSLGSAVDLVTSPTLAFPAAFQSVGTMVAGSATALRAQSQKAAELAAKNVAPKVLEKQAMQAGLKAGSVTEGVLAGAQVLGDIEKDLDKKGVVDPATRALFMSASIPAGAVTALLGRISNADMLLLMKAPTEAAKKATLSQIAGKLGVELTKGSIEEGLQSANEKSFTNIGTGRPVGENVTRAALEGAAVSPYLSGGPLLLNSVKEQQNVKARELAATLAGEKLAREQSRVQAEQAAQTAQAQAEMQALKRARQEQDMGITGQVTAQDVSDEIAASALGQGADVVNPTNVPEAFRRAPEDLLADLVFPTESDKVSGARIAAEREAAANVLQYFTAEDVLSPVESDAKTPRERKTAASLGAIQAALKRSADPDARLAFGATPEQPTGLPRVGETTQLQNSDAETARLEQLVIDALNGKDLAPEQIAPPSREAPLRAVNRGLKTLENAPSADPTAAQQVQRRTLLDTAAKTEDPTKKRALIARASDIEKQIADRAAASASTNPATVARRVRSQLELIGKSDEQTRQEPLPKVADSGGQSGNLIAPALTQQSAPVVGQTQRPAQTPSGQENPAVNAGVNPKGDLLQKRPAKSGKPGKSSVQQSRNADESGAGAVRSNVAGRVAQEIDAVMGQGAVSRMGGVSIVQNADALPERLRNNADTNTQALFDEATGGIFLIENAIPDGEAVGVLLHEIGHKRLEQAIGTDGMKRLRTAIDAWEKAPEGSNERRVWVAANRRAEAAARSRPVAGVRYSAADIARLRASRGMPMSSFAARFTARIGAKDRTMADAERIAHQVITDITAAPQEFLPNTTAADVHDYHSRILKMPDGANYDPENIAHANATPEQRAIHAVREDGSAARYEAAEAKRVNDDRANALRDTALYLTGNRDYDAVEAATLLAVIARYGVRGDAKAAGKTVFRAVELTTQNQTPIAVVDGAMASRVVGKMREGMADRQALVAAYQEAMDAQAEQNKSSGRNGLVKFAQSDKHGSAVELNKACAGTPWCTGATVGTAATHIGAGDFYVFYEDGAPQVAFRMTGNGALAEPPRGTNKDQSLTPRQVEIAERVLRSNEVPGGEDFISDQDFIKAVQNGTLPDDDLFLSFGRKRLVEDGYGDDSFDFPPSVYAEMERQIAARGLTEENGYYDVISTAPPVTVVVARELYPITATVVKYANLRRVGTLQIRPIDSLEMHSFTRPNWGDAFPSLTRAQRITIKGIDVTMSALTVVDQGVSVTYGSLSAPAMVSTGDVDIAGGTLSADTLRRVRDLWFKYAETKIFVPMLEEAALVQAIKTTDVSLPSLRKVLSLAIDGASNVSLPSLDTIGERLTIDEASNVVITARTIGGMWIANSQGIQLPELQEVERSVDIADSRGLAFPELRTIGGDVMVLGAGVIAFPELTSVGGSAVGFDVSSEVIAPKLNPAVQRSQTDGAAVADVPRDQSTYDSELIAYAIEEAERLGISPDTQAKQGTVAKWLSMVKEMFTNAMQKLFSGVAPVLTTQDLSALARGAAQLEIDSAAGAFDPSNTSVQYSKKATPPRVIPAPPSAGGAPPPVKIDPTGRWYSAIVDKQGALRTTMAELENMWADRNGGQKLPEHMRPKLLLDHQHSDAARYQRVFREEIEKPLAEAQQDVIDYTGFTRAELNQMIEDFDTLGRAPVKFVEQGGRIEANGSATPVIRDPQKPDRVEQLQLQSLAEHQRAYDAIAKLQRENGAAMPAIMKLLNAINDASARVLQVQVELGRRSAQDALAVSRSFRSAFTTSGYFYAPKVTPSDIRAVSRQATGATYNTGDDPIAKIYSMYQNSVVSGLHSQARGALADLSMGMNAIHSKTGEPLFVVDELVVRQHRDETTGEMVQDLMALSEVKRTADGIIVDQNTNMVLDPDAVTFWRDGKAYRMRAADDVMTQELKGYYKEGIMSDTIFPLLSLAASVFQKKLTTLSPFFATVDVWRNIQGVLAYLPPDVSRTDFMTNFPAALAPAAHGVMKLWSDEAPTGIFKEAQDNGALLAHRGFTGMDAEINNKVLGLSLVQTFEEAAARGTDHATAWQMSKLALEKTTGGLAMLGQFLDAAIRIAAYQSAVQAGKTPREAGQIAKWAATNFEVSGHWLRFLGPLYLFVNPFIRGWENQYRNLKSGNPHTYQFLAAYTALGFIMTAMAHSGSDTDEDGLKKSMKVSNSDRNTKALWSTDGGAKFHSLPLVQEASPAWVLGSAIADMTHGGADNVYAASRAVSALLNQMVPLNKMVAEPTDIKNNMAAWFVHLFAPTPIGAPIVQQAMNKDTYAKEIVPAGAGARGKSPLDLVRPGTSETAKSAAAWVYENTGAAVPPPLFDHWGKWAMAGLPKDTLNAVRYGQGDPKAKVPFLHKFTSEPNKFHGRDSFDKLHAELLDMEAGQLRGVYPSKPQLLSLLPEVKAMDRGIKAMAKGVGNMTEAEKEQRYQEIDRRRAPLLKRAYEAGHQP